MTFNDLNDAVKDEMKLDPGLVIDAERVRFFNDCLDEIAGLQLIELTTEDLTSTEYADLPVGLTKIVSVFWGNTKIRSLEDDTNPFSVGMTGDPYGYVLEGMTLRLIPAPSTPKILKLIYTGTPAYCTAAMLVTTNTTSPQLTRPWQRLLVDYACYRSHRKNGNIVMAGAYKNDFEKTMASNIRMYISFLNSQVVNARSDR